MAFRTPTTYSVLVVSLLGACGCMGPARLVSCDGPTGVVAIPANTNTWPIYNRKHAEEVMRERFPQGYIIDKEEEVIIGTTQHTLTDSDRTGDPLLAALNIAPVNQHTYQTVSYEDKKEWRIYFHAANSESAPAQGPEKQPPSAPR